MDRDKFIIILKSLAKAYSPKMKFTQEDVDNWYEFFSDYDDIGFQRAVEMTIREETYIPTPAVVAHYYRIIDKERHELSELVKSVYAFIRSYWGEPYDNDTHKAIIHYVMMQPKEHRREKLIDLKYSAASYAHECDAIGKADKPTIKEYIQGVR